MASRTETPVLRKKALAELFLIRRILANHANNTNQLAKWANAQRAFPEEAGRIYRDYSGIVAQLNSALRKLQDS
ncbi:plasmid mobilization relaxosome protein MobC [Naasia lichenicola]|nr:plasmid mobilization relaxosome protein MobC [Naasia lichenicola]